MAAHIFRLILFAGVMFFLNLGGFGLMDVDEPRNAGCAMEMFQRGDWITPTFNAELRTHKPALTYWFMMSAYSVFGVNEFSARFWSAVFGIGTVLMTYGIGRRLFNPQVGFWGGIILASSFFFAVSSRISTPDAPLIFCVTLAFFAFVMTAFRRPPASDHTAETAPELAPGGFPSHWLAGAAVYAAMGLAALAKGPVGVVLPTAVIGMFLLIARLPETREATAADLPWWRRALGICLRPFAPLHFLKTCWAMRPVTALLVCAAVAAPWYWLVHEATHGEWTRGFFLTHNLGRATNAMEGHGGPAGLYFVYLLYYPVMILAAFFPWSCFILPTIVAGRARRHSGDPWRHGLVFVACWVLVWVGAFSIARTKLPSYITPVYPGLALFVAAGVVRWLNHRAQLREFWFRWSFITLAISGLAMCIGLPIVAHFLFRGAEWTGVLGLVPLLGGLLGWREFRRGARGRALTAFAVSGSLLTLISLGGLLPYVFNRHQRAPELLAVAARNVHTGGKAPTILAFGAIEPSFVFNVRHPIPFFSHLRIGELLAAASADDTFIIARHKDAEWLNGKLPAGFTTLHRVPYFARPGLDLVLLGRKSPDSDSSATVPR